MTVDTASDTIRVIGELDIATAPALTHAANELSAARDATLDLTGLTFICAAGLGAIAGLRGRQSAAGSRLIVRGPVGAVARVFELARVPI